MEGLAYFRFDFGVLPGIADWLFWILGNCKNQLIDICIC